MENETTVVATKKPNIIKKTYDWILGWADSKWGPVALFILAFAESSFFPIPPDVLLIALCLGCPKKSFFYSTICLAGTLAGAVAAYIIGYMAWGAVSGWFIPAIFSYEAFEGVRGMYEQWNFWAVFTAGFTPIPYKIFTLAAGVFHIDFGMFMLASLIGRSMRFFLVGWLIWKFGKPIKSFINKYFNWIVMAFTVLLIGGFILIKYAF